MTTFSRLKINRIGVLALCCGAAGCSLPAAAPASSSALTATATNTNTPTINTAGVLCGISGSEFNDSESVRLTAIYSWTCTGSARMLSSNSLPNHDVGTFPGPGNPNPIAAVATNARYTLSPARTGQNTEVMTTGYALNGVKLEPGTAGSCDDSGRDCRMARSNSPWRLEAMGQSAFNFGTDDSNGHVQPNGQYHYHGLPEKLISKLGPGAPAMTLVAWAADGFPIYARYGYKAAGDAQSALAVLQPSYRLKTQPDSGRPAPALFAMGTFTQDYEYVAGSGDLDECNGRTGVTPEFPGGTYHYVMTESFPYISRCLKGTPASRR